MTLINLYRLDDMKKELIKFEKKSYEYIAKEESKGKVQRVPQSQTAALPRHQEEEDKIKYCLGTMCDHLIKLLIKSVKL